MKPGKQRKALFQAPDHKRHKHFAAHLSPELQASQKVKTLPVRSGDTVRVVRGDHKGFEGKVSRIDSKRYRIYIDGLTREKVDGTSIFVAIHPSKIMIKSLSLDDKWRKKIIERKRATHEEAEKTTKKPSKEPAETEKEVTEEKVKTEKAKEKKPSGRKKRASQKPKVAKTKEKAIKEEEKPKEKKARTKRKSTKKSEGGV